MNVYVLVIHTLTDALKTLHVMKMFLAIAGHTAAHSFAAMRPLENEQLLLLRTICKYKLTTHSIRISPWLVDQT